MALQHEKSVFLALTLIIGVHSCLSASQSSTHPTMFNQHEQWRKQYSRVYRDEIERAVRFEIFKDNVEFIDSFNRAGSEPYKLGINAFADLTNDEFLSSRGGYKISHSKRPTTAFKYANVTSVPESMDWRKKGAVTGVKNQLKCGSCWAFSTVAATEGIYKLKTGKLVSLAEQELIDCDVTSENQGCNGGLMDHAFKFIQNKGLTTESNYPYRGIDGACSRKKESSRAAKITGFEDVPANDESALLKAVANQPVAVAIDADGRNFQFYSGGIYTGGDCSVYVDHAVTVVGYGKGEDGTKYWLIKNSWGVNWGDEGYAKMKRDVSAEEGLCGIATKASYPTA